MKQKKSSNLYKSSNWQRSSKKLARVRVLGVVAIVSIVASFAVPMALARSQDDIIVTLIDSVQKNHATSGAIETGKTATLSASTTKQVDQQVKQVEAAIARSAQLATSVSAKSKTITSSAAVPPSSGTLAPSKILDLTNWYLGLPVDTPHAGTPDEIKQPELAGFILAPYFHVSGGGVVFQAHAGGATTKNSSYPRSELREMINGGTSRASWSNTEGAHTMTIRQAITQVPAVKPHVVAGQIHDASDDVIMVRLEGSHLFVEANGSSIGTLQQGYALGTVFTVKIETSGGQIRVYYNSELKVDYARPGSGFYFKAGVYTQSNTSKGDAADAAGQVVIYSLDVSHS